MCGIKYEKQFRRIFPTRQTRSSKSTCLYVCILYLSPPCPLQRLFLAVLASRSAELSPIESKY
jgi:hypothetical protein